MQLKKGWWLTTSTGKNWVAYQPKENGKFYREFTAKNFQEAKAIAMMIIKEYESRQRPSSKL